MVRSPTDAQPNTLVTSSDPNVVYVGAGSACIRGNVSTGRGGVPLSGRREDVGLLNSLAYYTGPETRLYYLSALQ